MMFENKFKKINMAQVEKLAKEGCTDLFMADFFGVSLSTWYQWKKKHTKFGGSLVDWKKEADENVVKSLYEKATGWIQEITMVSDDGKKVIERTIKHAPETSACKFWLTNRQRDEWRDKIDYEVGGGIDHEHTIHVNKIALDERIKQMVDVGTEKIVSKEIEEMLK